MSANSKIEWTDHTFNPWIGCTQVSPGCDGCYAKAWDRRFAVSGNAMRWGAGVKRTRTSAANWRQPLKWNKAHAAFFAVHGRRQRVFCASLADVFDNEVDPMWRADLFQLISETPNLDWLLLTKRIGNARSMLPVWYEDPAAWPESISAHANVWIGATICNQAEADRDIPKLLQVPARVRFLSMEPLLGPVDLTDISDGHADRDIPRDYWEEGFDTEDSPPAVGHNALTGERWQRFGEWREDGPRVDWVIVGGESGPNARPMHPSWARSLRDQCAAAGVPFLFKQWGEWMPPESRSTPYAAKDWRDVVDTTGQVRPIAWVGDRVLESSRQVVRVGKKAAGRLLDGREWNEVPPCS
ncbi:phage Gp37/Gp68 family protein [Hydrogenophaga sp.]|uniref:phage Gp37/Gp68 family protein n=1 Tax=Hydrogenophaga sp. TaxID=1904254 RepID=UPI003D0C5407